MCFPALAAASRAKFPIASVHGLLTASAGPLHRQASLPLPTMDPLTRLSWRCVNCKICECCLAAHESSEQEAKTLLYCERCDRAYHLQVTTTLPLGDSSHTWWLVVLTPPSPTHLCNMLNGPLQCLSPPLAAVPPGHFVCGLCVECTVCEPEAAGAEAGGAAAEAPCATAAGPAFDGGKWSTRPDRCNGCAGRFEGQTGDRCPVCRRGWGAGQDMASCEGCGAWVHSHCDEACYRILHPSPGNPVPPPGFEPRYFCPT